VLNALDVPCDMDAAYVTKFQILQDFVIDQYSQNRHVVLIIDEAQNLSVEGLEELRMLTNINANKDELLQLILMGQPELREMITRHELSQFAQRVTASFHIPDMDLETTREATSGIACAMPAARARNSPTAPSTASTASRMAFPGWSTSLCDFAMVYAVTSDKRSSRKRSSMRSWPTTSFSTWPPIGKPPNEIRYQVLLAHDCCDVCRLMMAIIVLFTTIGVVQALRLPPVYEAEARLLVESPQISDDLVDVTVTTSADEEITIIRERLLTRANLLEIADEFDVFENYSELTPDDRRS
jgi:hypothetical protein